MTVDGHESSPPQASGAEPDAAAPPGLPHPLAVPVVPNPADRRLTPETIAAIQRGVPESTRNAYSGDWQRFTTWCGREGRTALPATPETVAEYATHLTWKEGKAISTVDRALSSIRVRHAAAGLAKPDLTGARKVLTGYADHLARIGDPRAQPRRAAAADLPSLRAMLTAMDRTTLVGKRNAALLLLGFITAARESELIAVDLEHITMHPKGMEVRLYRGKKKQLQQLAVKSGTQGTETCPVHAYREWVQALAAHGRTSGPVFVRIDQHGNLGVTMTRHGRPIGDPAGRLSVRAVDGIIAGAARAAGLTPKETEVLLPRWSGHSLRRGFATSARRAGGDLLKIGRTGGWADGSKSLLGYIEEADRWDDSPLDRML
ncbi:tyrosine-type recombinase/integrase [Planomonospora sp. ID82291]|uniref:tyrosine-type recombinase/integrase n=1 Tax=Planomonospora sp. ID82291 TaxID=2738136 RepID=UPI0018C3C1B6|nr:tyrosine-type recombinase/integrase [Planomonospora sp. ID82291]MBG0818329.1 tyrosine-type recombinase/integrase [Planomonospora sp. ID82291]